MNEIVRESAKKSEAAEKGRTPQIRKSNYSQSINSSFDRILFLQRTIGNQAVWKLIKSGTLQAKLRIGQSGDEYEQEADRMDDQIIQITSNVEKKCPGCLKHEIGKEEKCEKVQRKETTGYIPEATPHTEANINVLKGDAKYLCESSRHSSNRALDYDFQRDHFCLTAPNPSNPKRKLFTSQEMQRASFGLWNARSIASRALMNIGQRDPYHLRIAERTFVRPITFDILDQHVGMIKSVLNNLTFNQNLFDGTCDEPMCNTGDRNFVAITLDDLSAIVLCPFYFLQNGKTLATTLLHEAGHMANIDVNWSPGNERYCRADDEIECDNICPLSGENLLENVDAWARFIYCISYSG